MLDSVKEKLNSMANDEETFLDFIRDSEKMLKVENRSLEEITLEELEEYIDFLDDMWTK
jgi:hypothetical protein